MKSTNSTTPTSPSTNKLATFFKVGAWVIGLLLVTMLGVYAYVNSEAGQRKVADVVNKYISDRIDTPFRVGKIRYDLPDWVSASDIYFADQSLDTLLATDKIRVDIDMLDLIRGKISIDEIRVQNIKAHLEQTQAAKEFNYQFLIDAFSSTDTVEVQAATSSSIKLVIDDINVDGLELTYLDEITAIDLKTRLQKAQVSFNKIDLDKNNYDVEGLALESGFVSLRTDVANEVLEEESTGDALGFNIEQVAINKVDWAYNGNDIGVNNKISFNKFGIDFNKIDLANELVDIDEVILENSEVTLQLFQVASSSSAVSSSTTPSNWKVKVGDVLLKSNKLTYDDLASPATSKGLDPGHIQLSNLNAKIQDIGYSNEQTSLAIDKLQFEDKSSFRINEFEGKVSYTDQKINLEDFKIATPQSKLDFNTLLTFSSLEDLTTSIEKVKFDVSIVNSFISMKDVLLLQPTLVADSLFDKMETLNLKFDTKLAGSYGDFVIDRMKISGLEKTELLLNGKVKGLNNFEKLQTDLAITKIATSRQDIEVLVGDMEALADINIPEELSLTGKIKGNGERVDINAALLTTLGELKLNGALLNLANTSLTTYEGSVETEELMVNKLFKEDYQLGRLSTKVDLMANAALSDLKVKGLISKVFYNGYDYSDLNLDLAMKDSIVNLVATSLDQNFNLETELELDLNNEKMPAKGQIEITNINLKKVNIYDLPDPISGFIQFDMSSTLPESLIGNFVSNRLKIGSKSIGESKGVFENNAGVNQADFSSGFMNLKLSTSAPYTEISDVVLAEINNYYLLDSTRYSSEITYHNLDLNLVVKDHPIWSTFAPDLTFKKSIVLNIEKDNSGLKSTASFGDIRYLDYELEGFDLAMNGNGEALDGLAKLSKFAVGTTRLDKNELEINVANSKLQATYISNPEKGKEASNKMSLSVEKLADGIQLYLQKLRLENTNYTVNDSPIFANENGVQINNLILSKGSENLVINSSFQEVAIKLNGIEIRPFVDLAGYASYDINGTLFGDFYIEDYMQDYVAKGNIGLKKFIVQGVDNGNVNVLISRLDGDQVSIEAEVIGKNTNATLNGYLGFQDNLPLDFDVDLQRFDTKLIEQLAPDAVRSADGFISGKLSLNGTSDKPNVTGKLGFEKVKINSTYLGTPIRVNDQAIKFSGQVVSFDNFIILDSLNQKLKLNGKVNWSDLDKVNYDLALDTKNFLLLDSKKGVNQLYYGKANIDANLSIKGIGEKPTVGGNVKVNASSDVTIIMPAEIEDINGSDIVTFVPPKDYKAPEESEEEKQSNLESIASFTNEIIVDIETDPKAQLAIVVDEFSGDNIKVKGQANITAGIYPSGDLFMIGVYEIESGSYDFSLEFLKRNFQLEKGGTIIWSGDPYKASIQLQAYYEVNTDIQSLNSLGLNVNSYGKVPIDVLLKIEGTIENPLISFDFRPSAKAESSIKSLMESNDIFASLRKNQSEMNQQVFSLLVFNKFFNDQTISSSGSVINSQAIARQSVSKLLTEQLNMLADDFLGSVGLNFGLDSDQLNTGSGEAYRTNLSVGLNKTFLNDRVRVSVGKNFELENTSGLDQNSAEILDNIEVSYNITPDGRYAVKVYRNNQFQTVLEGFVLETGVSFVLTGDYNSFGELFNKNKDK
ncbi:Family of unknown function [Spirosomataceae bacterium TFI 002]|nr:Family of unknown function [Spirosomataceae bacterium TFI 002]